MSKFCSTTIDISMILRYIYEFFKNDSFPLTWEGRGNRS